MPLHLFPTGSPGSEFAEDLQVAANLKDDQYGIVAGWLERIRDQASADDLEDQLEEAMPETTNSASIKSLRVLRFILSEWTEQAMDLSKFDQDLQTLGFEDKARQNLISRLEPLLKIAPVLHHQARVSQELATTGPSFVRIEAAFDLRAVYRTARSDMASQQDTVISLEPLTIIKVTVDEEEAENYQTYSWQMTIDELEQLYVAIVDFRLRASELQKLANRLKPTRTDKYTQ